MAKKKKVKAVAEDAVSVANTIWLAGLGALATTQEEGSKLFKHLVKKGEGVDFKGKVGVDGTIEKARTQVSETKDRIEDRVEQAKGAVSDAWGDLSQSFDDQLGSALHRLGVPTRDEIKTLTARVEALIEKVEQAEAKPKRKAPARRTRKAATTATKKAAPAKKAASKTAAAKKPAAKRTTKAATAAS